MAHCCACSDGLSPKPCGRWPTGAGLGALVNLPRIVQAETLDHLASDDPAAQRSRRDLVRVHRAMRSRSITARAWRALVGAERAQAPLKILEIGAGDGTLLLGVARALAPKFLPALSAPCSPQCPPAFAQVQLTLLDRQAIVSPATVAAYAALGWTATPLQADVLDWSMLTASEAAGSGRGSWDLISTSLFLHHFEGQPLRALLRAAALRAPRFFALEPRRAWPAWAGSHLVGALGANAVTRQDAVLSVHAGFRGAELSALWPAAAAGAPAAWQLREQAAGWFSHVFTAQALNGSAGP